MAATVSPTAAPAAAGERVRWLAAAGVCGLALSAHATVRVGTVESGVAGALVSRLDVAGAVLIVLASYAGALTARTSRAGRAVPGSARASRLWTGIAWRTLVVVYPVWWVALGLAFAVASPRGDTRHLAQAALFFRTVDHVPVRGAAVGWLVGTALVAFLAGAWWALRPGRRPARTALIIVIAGLALRLALVAADRTDVYGVLASPLGHLDLVGAGLVVATFRTQLMRRRRTAFVLAGATVLAFLVAAFCVGLERGGRPLTSRGDILVESIAALLVATGVVATLAVTAPPDRTATGRRRALRLIAIAAPGLILWHEAAVDLVVRQYRERVRTFDGARFVTGTVLPAWVWAVCVAVAVGTVLTTLFAVPARRLAGGRWPRHWFELGFVAITGGAFLVRVLTMLAVAPERTDQGDPLYYHTTANLIAKGRGFAEPNQWIAFGKLVPSALHGPLYSMSLALSSRIGGTAWVDHRFVSLLIGTGVVVLTGVLARPLAGPIAALIAMGLAAVYPNLWLIDSAMFPEGLLALCSLGCVILAYRWRDRPRLTTAAAIGATIGLAALTRGEGILLAVLLVVPWMGLRRYSGLDGMARLRHLGMAAVACLAVIAPWMIHNAARFNVFVPLSTNGNELVVYSYCDDAFRGPYIGFWSFACEERIRGEREAQGLPRDPPGDEAEKALFWRDVGVEYAKDHLGELPKVVAARVGRQWELFRPWQNASLAPIEGRDLGSARVGLVMYYGLVAASVAGLVGLRRRKLPILPFVAVAASVTITAAAAYGTTRFRAPAEPLLCVLAGAGLVPLWVRVSARLRRRADVPIGDGQAFVLGGSPRPSWSWRGATAAGIVAAVVALPLRGLYRTTGATMEEGFMLVFPDRVRRGDVPNVDFLHLYGPGSLDALAGWYGLFGTTLEAERTFGLLQHVGIIAAIYVIARGWGRVAAVASAVLAAILVLTPIGLQALAWNGGLALGLWSVVFAIRARAPAVRHRTAWWAAAGAAAGLALTFRPDLVIALALALGWMAWRRGVLRPLAAGVVAGLTPLWIHLLRAGPRASFDGMILDPVFRLRAGRQLPRPPTFQYVDGALQAIAEKFPPWWGVPHPPASVQLFAWFFVVQFVGIALAVTAIVVHRRAAEPSRTGVLVAASLFALGVLPQALQRPDSAHFAWVSCVSFPLVPLAVLEVVRLVRPYWNPLARMLLAVGCVAVTYAVVFPFYSYRAYVADVRLGFGFVDGGREIERGGRRFYLGDERSWLAFQAVAADLDRLSKPGERLLVGPADLRQTIYSDAFFYYLFPELTPATYFIEMDPGLANADDSRLTDDVRSADWVVLTRLWSGWIEPNGSTRFGPDAPNAAVENNFCLVGTYQHDLIRLYHRTDPANPACPLPSPGPYEGPYEPNFDYAVDVSVPVPPRASDGTYPPGSPAATYAPA
jgi:hypothetical protein